jgi:hypothetical protein
MRTSSSVDKAPSADIGRTSQSLEQASFAASLRHRLSDLPTRLAPVTSTVRSLAGCFLFLGALAPNSDVQAAGPQQLPYRAQWGDPNYVVLSWKGGSQIMTYQQFFAWVGQKHPNEVGVKVVGELPAHINQQNTSTAVKPAAVQHPGQSAPKSSPYQQQAWQKYQADLARWKAYQAGQAQVAGAGRNNFWRSVGSSLGDSLKQLGSSLRNDPLGIRTPTAPPPLVVRPPSRAANKRSVSSSTQRLTPSTKGSKSTPKVEPVRVKSERKADESAKPRKVESPRPSEPAATPEIPRAIPLPSFDSGVRVGGSSDRVPSPNK